MGWVSAVFSGFGLDPEKHRRCHHPQFGYINSFGTQESPSLFEGFPGYFVGYCCRFLMIFNLRPFTGNKQSPLAFMDLASEKKNGRICVPDRRFKRCSTSPESFGARFMESWKRFFVVHLKPCEAEVWRSIKSSNTCFFKGELSW